MLGRDKDQDRAGGDSDQAGFLAVGFTTASPLYERGKFLKYREAPQNLTASPRPSETNISNMPVRVVVAQLAPQTQSRAFKKMLSRPLVLRPGNQSLGGT